MPLSVVIIDAIYFLDYRYHHHHHYFKIRLQLSDNSGIQKPNDKDFLNVVSPSPPLWVWFSFNRFVPWNSESTFFFTISPFWPLNAEDIVFLIENTHGTADGKILPLDFQLGLNINFSIPELLEGTSWTLRDRPDPSSQTRTALWEVLMFVMWL